MKVQLLFVSLTNDRPNFIYSRRLRGLGSISLSRNKSRISNLKEKHRRLEFQRSPPEWRTRVVSEVHFKLFGRVWSVAGSSADTHEEKSINRKHLCLKVFYLLKSV